jgi:5'-AMP-activated protein kinase catalytic alpha subunit
MITSINSNLFPGFGEFKQIGRGSYGIVYKAKHLQTGQHIAIKTVDKINLMTESNRNVLRNELDVYSKICHPFLAQYFVTLEDQAGFYTAIEYINNGTLLDFIMQHGKLRENDCAKIFCELISVVKYLHEDQQIIHRDIKADNILIDGQINIRLIDFGLSDFMQNETSTFDTKCGSYPYSAPEMLKGQKYTKSIDIWSCGVVLYMMLTGSYPFADKNRRELYNQIVYQEPQYPPFLSPMVKDLLAAMLMKNPEDRIGISGIAEHPWVTSSRNCAFLYPDFITRSMEKVNPHKNEDINYNVINYLKIAGVDVTTVVEDLFANKFTEATVLYKIYVKQEMMKDMQSPGEIRTMFGIRKKMARDGNKRYEYSHKKDVRKLDRKNSTSIRCRSVLFGKACRVRKSVPIKNIEIGIKSVDSLPSLTPNTIPLSPFF